MDVVVQPLVRVQSAVHPVDAYLHQREVEHGTYHGVDVATNFVNVEVGPGELVLDYYFRRDGQ